MSYRGLECRGYDRKSAFVYMPAGIDNYDDDETPSDKVCGNVISGFPPNMILFVKIYWRQREYDSSGKQINKLSRKEIALKVGISERSVKPRAEQIRLMVSQAM